jgi:hypothetical protein
LYREQFLQGFDRTKICLIFREKCTILGNFALFGGILHHPKLLPAQNSRFQACFSKAVRQISEALKDKIWAAISRAEKPGPVRKCGQSPMDTAREAELVPIFYREPSREHSTRSLALSALERCMGMAGSLARAV